MVNCPKGFILQIKGKLWNYFSFKQKNMFVLFIHKKELQWKRKNDTGKK